MYTLTNTNSSCAASQSTGRKVRGDCRWRTKTVVVNVLQVGTSDQNGQSSSSLSHLSTPSVVSLAIRPAAPQPAMQPSFPPPECLPPAGIYNKAVELGTGKANMDAWKIVVAGVAAGAFIGFGAALSFVVGGGSPALAQSHPGLHKFVLGAVGLPFGLLMVVATGAELFTGNTALVTAAAMEGKATARQLLKSWVCSYIGNILGSLALVALFSASGAVSSLQAPIAAAVAKTSLTFSQAFVRGILCNWLVCMAVWQATATSSFFGKGLACLLPVSAFVAMGLEHSVANMFIVPMGMSLGAPVSVQKFLMTNLLPVSLGNIVGGAVCVAALYSACFGALGRGKKSS